MYRRANPVVSTECKFELHLVVLAELTAVIKHISSLILVTSVITDKKKDSFTPIASRQAWKQDSSHWPSKNVQGCLLCT